VRIVLESRNFVTRDLRWKESAMDNGRGGGKVGKMRGKGGGKSRRARHHSKLHGEEWGVDRVMGQNNKGR